MKKKVVIVLLCIVAGAIILFAIFNKKSPDGLFVESTEGTESVLDNVVSSFGGEEETEVKNDAEAKYTMGSSGKTYTEEELPEYMRKLQEADPIVPEADEYKYPTFEYGEFTDGEDDSVWNIKSQSECTWYYIENGKTVTVDGVKSDNVPTGSYLCESAVSGAETAEEAGYINIQNENSGYYLGGVNIPAGYYNVAAGHISTPSSMCGLKAKDGKIYTSYQGTNNGMYEIDDNGCIDIVDGVYYYLSDCVLESEQ